VRARTEAGRVRRELARRPVRGGVPMRRLDRWQAEKMREGLADLYVESSFAEPGEGYRQREEFLRRLAADVRRPGFDMLIAQGRTLVGCVFGFPVGRDGSWWAGLRRHAPGEPRAADRVRPRVRDQRDHDPPDERDKGTGRLQEALLADQDASLGVTMVDGGRRDLPRSSPGDGSRSARS
jgi:hypothetical protein